MKKQILRDVMNSKSSSHFRHSVDAYDIKALSFYYAIESRVFNSIWNTELQKNTRGPLWFTNIMVFDFDFDEKHFPNVIDYENKLNDSLSKLESILGKPHYKITNKTIFSNWEKETYFTKFNQDGSKELNLPKAYGCQVVYELSDSLKSQYSEQVKLFNKLRLKISEITDADLNFKGHMFKNIYNKNLFNIVENKEYSKLDIYSLSQKYLNMPEFDLNKIKSLKEYEELGSVARLPKPFVYLNNKLFCFYQDLNSWKHKGTEIKNKFNFAKAYGNGNFTISDSRNETLFNYLRSLPLNVAKKVEYKDVANSNLFNNCLINKCLDESEFLTTKESVIEYREENDICNNEYYYDNEEIKIVDNRVFKIDQSELNLKFFNENKHDIKKSILYSKYKKSFKCDWLNSKLKVKLYDNNSKEEFVSNLFLIYGAEKILSNVRNLFTPDFVTYLNNQVTEFFKISRMGLHDMYTLIKDAIYLTHFKYYYSIQDFRNSKSSKSNKNKRKINTKRVFKDKKVKSYGVKYNGNILGFNKFYSKLLSCKMLKDNGCPLAISYYQQFFHIKNIEATLFVRKIKAYLKVIAFKRNCNFDYSKNTTNQIELLINNFIISYNYNKLYYINNIFYLLNKINTYIIVNLIKRNKTLTINRNNFLIYHYHDNYLDSNS